MLMENARFQIHMFKKTVDLDLVRPCLIPVFEGVPLQCLDSSNRTFK